MNAVLLCADKGKVGNKPSQDFVRIDKSLVLIENDPEGRPIGGCTNYAPMMGIKPCTTTLKVKSGYSDFIKIAHMPVCLSTVEGLTDGTPAGAAKYSVSTPGQSLVVAGS